MNSEEVVQARIPAVLQRIRRQSGLSQERLGELIGLSKNTVRNYEQGLSRPPLGISISWCAACGYPPQNYIADIYGVQVVTGEDLESDRAAIRDFAATAQHDELHLVAELIRKMRR